MKRQFFLFLFVLFASTSVRAQFEQVKTFLVLSQFAKAKEALDAIEKKGKATTKPEFNLAKAALLAGMSRSVQGDTAEKYLAESIEQFRKFQSADQVQNAPLLQDQAYSTVTFVYYGTLFNKAIALFNAKKYAEASENFAKTVEWSDYLIKTKQLASDFDTTLYLYAGASSQLSDNAKAAMSFYERLAGRKVAGKDYIDVYKYMSFMYFKNKDKAGFDKSMALGRELYPSESMFKVEELDFALDIEDESERIARLKEMSEKDPENARLNETYGRILFDKLNKTEVDNTTSEYAADEQKMLSLLNKAASSSSDDGISFFLMGKHFWYKSDRVRNQITDINDAIRKFNDAQKPDKSGKTPPPPKNLTAGRDSLRTQQASFMDQAIPYLLKAQPIMAQNHTKVRGGTQNYKLLIDDLVQYYGFKRQYAKTPAEKAKAEAEEKKWDKIYSEITQ
jgi:hypothetical protein